MDNKLKNLLKNLLKRNFNYRTNSLKNLVYTSDVIFIESGFEINYYLVKPKSKFLKINCLN